MWVCKYVRMHACIYLPIHPCIHTPHVHTVLTLNTPDDVTYVYDDVTYVYDDVTYVPYTTRTYGPDSQYSAQV